MSNERAWASFTSLTGKGYGIGPLPGLKRVALYQKTPPNSIRAIAHFKDEQDAADFLEWLVQHTDHIDGGGA